MSTNAFANLLIGMARDFQKKERRVQKRLERLASVPFGTTLGPDLQGVRYQHQNDLRRNLREALLRDNYFNVRDVERVVSAVMGLFQNSTPAYKPKTPRPPRPPKSKICGAINGTMLCELPLGHNGWHGDRARKYGFAEDKRPKLCSASYESLICTLLDGHRGTHWDSVHNYAFTTK